MKGYKVFNPNWTCKNFKEEESRAGKKGGVGMWHYRQMEVEHDG